MRTRTYSYLAIPCTLHLYATLATALPIISQSSALGTGVYNGIATSTISSAAVAETIPSVSEYKPFPQDAPAGIEEQHPPAASTASLILDSPPLPSPSAVARCGHSDCPCDLGPRRVQTGGGAGVAGGSSPSAGTANAVIDSVPSGDTVAGVHPVPAAASMDLGGDSAAEARDRSHDAELVELGRIIADALARTSSRAGQAPSADRPEALPSSEVEHDREIETYWESFRVFPLFKWVEMLIVVVASVAVSARAFFVCVSIVWDRWINSARGMGSDGRKSEGEGEPALVEVQRAAARDVSILLADNIGTKAPSNMQLEYPDYRDVAKKNRKSRRTCR
ncbi:hypothetical protein BC834DRAFT_843251 [Gloeopeniophorella convolvens]|nr:hypothetical protein BC834DRAFT_843251 [Gloeopeniophorella convolvens]